MDVRIQLPADVHQIDATGYVWTFLDEADDPDQIQVGQTVLAGDPDDPFQAQVVDVIIGSSGRQIVHLAPLHDRRGSSQLTGRHVAGEMV